MRPLTYREELLGAQGFVLGLRFTPEELRQVEAFVLAHWLARIEAIFPDKVDEFRKIGLSRYHELSHLVDHSALWGSRLSRILPKEAAIAIRAMSPFRQIERELGEFFILDEPKNGWDEFCFRLVRPGQKNDVGPLHADIWFHRIQELTFPKGMESVKGWLAISVETGVSGLAIVPGSHLKQWAHTVEERDGARKPRAQFDESTLTIQPFQSEPGDMILFNEGLLHRGIPHDGKKTRVSLEFTLVVSLRKQVS